MRQLFKKAYCGGKDPWLALLDHRDTPTEGVDATQPRDSFALNSFKILHRSCCGKRKKAKFYHDRQAKQLPQLEIGHEVSMGTIDYAEFTRRNMVPASRSFQTDHTSHNQVTAQWEETINNNYNEMPREPVIPEQTPSSGKAAVIKTPTVNVEPSVPVAQKARTSGVNLVASRLADFDIKRWTFYDFGYFFLLSENCFPC